MPKVKKNHSNTDRSKKILREIEELRAKNQAKTSIEEIVR
jgi:hypothetical protein